MAEEPIGDDVVLVSESSSTEMEFDRLKLRKRWELASVLNFLNVFEPVIQSNMKVSAEEIEMALIMPDNLLAQLHITLLKGIPPVSKILNDPDAWVTALCKKLAMWWRWVAEGDYPLAGPKGEEISRYKELDPTIRLLILKALCEIRADQYDSVSYINDAIKSGTEIHTFRKDEIVGDGNGTKYWCDGNAIIGYRLYKEVNIFDTKPNITGEETMPAINSRWDTLATCLEEFREVVDEFSSSGVKLEVVAAKSLEMDPIPVLEKLQKKKERALNQQQKQEKLLNGFQNSGIIRTVRNRGPVTYTFDEYDKAIDEAIQVIKKRKTVEEQRHKDKHNKQGKSNEMAMTEGLHPDANSSDSESTESDRLQGGDSDDGDDDEYNGKEDSDGKEDGGVSSNFIKENDSPSIWNKAKVHSQKQNTHFDNANNKLAGVPGRTVPKNQSLGAKNRLRQRPTRNTAFESAVVPDSSEDENLLGNIGNRIENVSADAE